jgi:Tfp pilus assembly protein PilF
VTAATSAPEPAASHRPARRLVWAWLAGALVSAGLVLASIWWRQAKLHQRALVQRQSAAVASELSRGEVLFQQRRPAEALPHILRAAELEPDRAATHMLLAEIYDDLRRTHEMIGPLRKALAIDPGLTAARLNLSYALIWSGDTLQGRREAEECLRQDPDSVPARRLVAQCDRDEGHPEAALENIRQGLAIAPDDLESRLLEAELLLFLRRADEACSRLESLPADDKTGLRALTLLARAAAVAGRAEAAANYRRQIDRLNRSAAQPEDQAQQ